MRKNYAKQPDDNNRVKKEKIMIKFEQYIDFLSESVVFDADSPDRKYYNIKDLIAGIIEDYSSDPTFRLPSETSQRKWINDFVLDFTTSAPNEKTKKNSVDYDLLIKACRKKYAQKELLKLTHNTYDIMYQGEDEVISKECYPSTVMFVPAGNENRILNCLTTYFNNDTIKGAICGYKCITIFFENFITQESFITNLTQLLNIPEIKKNHTSGGTQA